MSTNNNSKNKAMEAFLAQFEAEEKAAREKAAARREARVANREITKEEFLNNSTLAVVKGYAGCMAYTASNVGDQKNIATKVVDNGHSNQVNTMAGIMLAVKNFLAANDKKRIVIYAYSSEVRRVAGFIKRIKEGSDDLFTKEEMETIQAYDKVYGKPYMDVCEKTFALLEEAHEKGLIVRLMSLDSITGTPLTNKKLPVKTLDGQTVYLNNGKGNCLGYYIQLVNSNLSGTHKIVAERGQLKVTRGDINSKEAMEKMPEAFWANKLYNRVSNAINDTIDIKKEVTEDDYIEEIPEIAA